MEDVKRTVKGDVPKPGPRSANASEGEKSIARRLSRFAWLPIPILFLLVVVLSLNPNGPILGVLPLLPVFNLAFLTLVCLLVAVLAARSYLINGSPTFLFLGSGVLAYGVTSLLASFSVPAGDYNTGATIYYLGVPLAGFFCLLSVFWLQASTGRRQFRPFPAILVVAYAAVLVGMTAIYLSATHGLLPTFFMEGVGPTALRQTMLGVGFVGFAGTSLLILVLERRNRSVFLDWYALGLALIAVGLLGAIDYKNYDSLLAWVGRGCHYLGGIYLLVALVATMRSSGGWVIPLATLRETYDRYIRLVDASPDAILVLAEGRVVFANPATVHLFGVPLPEQLLGLQLPDLVHPASRQSVEDYLGALLSGRKVAAALEAKVLCRGGLAVNVELAGVPVTDEGRPAIQVVLRDITERKLKEEKIAYLASFPEVNPNPVFEAGMDGTVTYVSPAANRLFPDLTAQNKDHPLLSGFDEIVVELMGGNPSIVRDVKLNEAFYQQAIFYVPDHGVFRFYNLDITERKRAEEALRESKARLEAVFSSMNDGVIIFDADGRVTSANEAGARFHRFTDKDDFLMSLGSYAEVFDIRNTDGTTLNTSEWPVSRALRGEVVYNQEMVVTNRESGESWVGDFSAAPIRDEQGNVVAAVVTMRDVTERKQAEDAIARLSSIVSSSQDAIIGKTLDGVITSWNHAAELLYGYTADEAIGRSIEFIVPDDRKGEVGDFLDKIRRGEHVERYETVRVAKVGRKFDVSITISPIFDHAGQIIGASTITHDITERKRAEKELAEAKAQAELYLDLMGHDINNMNMVAAGFLELAQAAVESEGRLDSSKVDLLDGAMASINNSSKLIGNVRKLQRGRMGECRTEVYDLGGLIEEVCGEFKSSPERYVHIACGAIKGVRVEANELLRDVFANLIGNAIKHSNGPAYINVRMSRARVDGCQYYKVTIEDNGPGVPDNMKEKIFNRLSRGDTKAHGTGLGLYLVKTLVEGYGGRVWVEDRVEGDHTQGARFVVMLPIVGDRLEDQQ